MSYHSFFSRPLSLKILNKLRAKNTGFKIKVKEYQYRLSKKHRQCKTNDLGIKSLKYIIKYLAAKSAHMQIKSL